MRKSYINKMVKGMAVGAAVMILSCTMPASVYATESVTVENQDNGITPMEGTYYVSTEMGLNVRDNPSTSSNKLGLLDYGKAVNVKGITQDGWFVIDYNGAEGYIASKYMSDTPVAANHEDEPEVSEAPVDESQQESVEATTEQTTQRETETEVSGLDIMSGGTKAVLAVVVLALFGLIGYTAYSIFKTSDNDDEYEYYEGEQYSDDEYYEDEQYSDDEYYEEEQYSDEGYYGDEQYSDDEYYEDEQYSDEGYYEDEYVDNQYSDNNVADDKYLSNKYASTTYSNKQMRNNSQMNRVQQVNVNRPQPSRPQTGGSSPKSLYFGNNTTNNSNNFGNTNPRNKR